MDGDRDGEIVAGGSAAGLGVVRVYLNDAGAFGPSRTVALAAPPSRIAVDDVNGDLAPDIVASLSGPAMHAVALVLSEP